MSLPRYPEYKDSGVEWLGEVPTHWNVVPTRAVATLNDEVLTESTPKDYEIEYVDIGSVSLLAGIERTELLTFGAAPSRARRVVRNGDVLVSTVRTYLKAIAPIQSAPPNLVASTGFAVIRPKTGQCSSFLKYGLQCEQFVQQVIARSTGVSYPAINSSDLARIPLWSPPLEEQLAIGVFLDRETARIDALIAEQETLLTLLAEKRQATISHAVTRGLDPNVPMKDSGISWLGEVPAHWVVVPIKQLSPVQRGASPRPIEDPRYFDEEGEYSWVRISDVSAAGGVLRSTEQRLSDLGSSLSVKLEPGALFVSIAGSVGKPCITDIKACIHDGFVYLPRLQIPPMFLFRIFEAGSCYAGLGKMGTQLNLNTDTVGAIQIALPPKNELRMILEFLDQRLAAIDRLVADSHAVISLLRERRSALISAAVTGQIDVRGLMERQAA